MRGIEVAFLRLKQFANTQNCGSALRVRALCSIALSIMGTKQHEALCSEERTAMCLANVNTKLLVTKSLYLKNNIIVHTDPHIIL